MKNKMKNNIIITVLFFLIGNVAISQILHFHTHFNNTDTRTQRKLTTLIGTLGQRNTALLAINKNLTEALIKHKTQLNLKYTTNKYDKEDSFLTSSLTSMSLSLATSILGAYANMPYMPKTKRDYLNAVTMDKSILLAIQYIDAKKVSSGQRQEIYRLRSQIIREFSKNDRESREILMFSAGAMALLNYPDFIELKNKLDAIEISF